MLNLQSRVLGGSHELDLKDISTILLNSEEQRKDDPERRVVKQMWGKRNLHLFARGATHICDIH